MEEIEIFELKRMDLRGATVIDGFPSVGLVSTITANYLISTLKLEQIGVLDSIHFPTVSVVRNAEPLNPVRVYGGELKKSETVQSTKKYDDNMSNTVVVFISEFQPPPNLIKMIASTTLDWMQEQGCLLLISPEGLVIDRGDSQQGGDSSDPQDSNEIIPYGIGSTVRARKLLETYNIAQFQEGVISGVAGVLLNEGRRRNFDVISILAEARPNFPDARAAAKVIETIDKILLHVNIDVQPLYKEAEGIEEKIKAMQKQAKQPTRKSTPKPEMYG